MPNWFKWALVILQASVILQVFAIGLRTSWESATWLFRRPKLLWNSILARNVVVPIVAILLVKIFSFHPAIAIALGVLAVTPVPPLLPTSDVRVGTRCEYVLGLLVSQAVLAIVLVPLTIQVMNWAFGAETHFSSSEVAILVGKTILIPLALGMLAWRMKPALERLVPPLLTAGSAMLIVSAIPLLLIAWKTLGTLVGNGAMLALTIFMMAGTIAGHVLGGPLEKDRTTLALASSARHPGLALAIASANFPEQKLLVAGAVFAYLILRLILVVPYTNWRAMAPAPATSFRYARRHQ